MSNPKTVYFVGSGPGDPELITLKGKRLVEQADVIIYSGSLLNPQILDFAKKDVELHDASLLNREEIFTILKDAALSLKTVIRFHDGDPSLFSTIREQIDNLEKFGINCEVVPGVTALLGAASSLKLELTLPGNTQTVIITRAEFRTRVPEREKISELAKHGATMVFYLSTHLIEQVVKEILEGNVYVADTPVAVVYKATWDDEIIITGTLDDIAEKVKRARLIKTALIIVGSVINPVSYEYSKVYDSEFTHGFRRKKMQSSISKT